MPHPDGEIIKYACLRVCVCVYGYMLKLVRHPPPDISVCLWKPSRPSHCWLKQQGQAERLPPAWQICQPGGQAESKREKGGKFLRGFISQGTCQRQGLPGDTHIPSFPTQGNKRDWHFRWHKNVFGTNLSSWFNPRSTSVFCVNSQVSCQNLMDQLCSSSSKLKPGAYIWYSTVQYCTIRYVYDIQSLTVHYSMIRCKVMWYKIRYS